jgi:uncharacterized protein YciI
MTYAVICKYTPDTSIIAKARPSHREYLTDLQSRDKLVISGPFTDDKGGLLVYEADSEDEVDKMIREDPFAIHGVFVSWEIRPWNVVFRNKNLLCK